MWYQMSWKSWNTINGPSLKSWLCIRLLLTNLGEEQLNFGTKIHVYMYNIHIFITYIMMFDLTTHTMIVNTNMHVCCTWFGTGNNTVNNLILVSS